MANLETVRSMEKGNTIGQINHTTKDLGRKTSFTAMEHTYGPMAESTLVNGIITLCMEWVRCNMKMAAFTEETISRTKSTAKVSTYGQIKNDMREDGKTENSMARGSSPIKRVNQEWVSGIMEYVSSGSPMKEILNLKWINKT